MHDLRYTSHEGDHMPTALLVDRDLDTRRMYAEFLRHSAFETDEAEDGREALVKALTRHPDVIVMETRLPGISGFDLCRLLRSDSVTQDIPLVIVTGDAFESDLRRARDAGADTVLTKPCLPEHLASEVKRLMSTSVELRAKAQAIQSKATAQVALSTELVSQSRAARAKRQMLSRSHQRRETTEPPVSPPSLRCPACDVPLKYVRSHVGGVSVKHQEQWDYFECGNGCGTFQFRQRTRRVRRIA